MSLKIFFITYYTVAAVLSVYFFLVLGGPIGFDFFSDSEFFYTLGHFDHTAWRLLLLWLIIGAVFTLFNLKHLGSRNYIAVFCLTLGAGAFLFAVFIIGLIGAGRAARECNEYAGASKNIAQAQERELHLETLEILNPDTLTLSRKYKMKLLPRTAWLEKIPCDEIEVVLGVTFDVIGEETPADSCVFEFGNRDYRENVCVDGYLGHLGLKMYSADVADTIWLYGEREQTLLIKVKDFHF